MLTHILHQLKRSRRAIYRQDTCRLDEHPALRLGHQDSSLRVPPVLREDRAQRDSGCKQGN